MLLFVEDMLMRVLKNGGIEREGQHHCRELSEERKF